MGRLSDNCECENTLTEEQCGFRPQRSTGDMMFVVRQLQELARTKDTPIVLVPCRPRESVRLRRPNLSVACPSSFWRGTEKLAVISKFHDAIQARVQFDDGEYSDKFDARQDLRQGCVLTPLVFKLFFTAVLRVAVKRFLSR